MQNPYNRYQKNQTTSKSKKKSSKKPAPRVKNSRRLKSMAKAKSSAPNISLGWVAASFVGVVVSFYILNYTDQFVDIISRIQVGMSSSMAADGAETSTKEGKNGSKSDALPPGKISELSSDTEKLTMKNANVYKALKDKRRELEKKERRLAQLEEELQKQKVEIERQLTEMQDMRRNISSKLDHKVKADQESINKLVGVYSNMKPQNAAIILSQIDDDLAIKVLGKMKKQSAAAILNYVAPKKAQYLSEKFTGLKK